MLYTKFNFPSGDYPYVTLDSCQQGSGIHQALERDSESQKRGHSDARGLNSKQKEYSLAGSIGEVAAHVFLALPFEYSINRWKDCDLVTKKKACFDVKCSQKFSPFVFVAKEHQERGHNFLFTATEDNRTVYMLGFLRNAEVAKFPLSNPGNRTNKDGTPAWCYRIPLKALHPVPQGGN